MIDENRKWKISDNNGYEDIVKNDNVNETIKKLLYLGHSNKIIIELIKE